MTATFGWSGTYPIWEKPTFGSRIQPGTAFGSTVQVTTLPVWPAGRTVLRTYQPFWASIRPS